MGKTERGGNSCAVATCTNISSKTQNKSYHSFPRDLKSMKEWVAKCRRGDSFNAKTSRICSDHFTVDDYIRDLRNELLGLPLKRILKPNAVPSVLLPSANINTPTLARNEQINRTKKTENNTLEGIYEEVEVPTEHFTKIREPEILNDNLINDLNFQWREKYEKLYEEHQKLKRTTRLKIKNLESLLKYYKSKCKNGKPSLHYIKNKCTRSSFKVFYSSTN